MTFANLSAFVLFSLLGIILLIYFLKGKRQDKVISSTILWKNVSTDSLSFNPRWRLKPELLLFFHLLIAALLVTALMQPYTRYSTEILQPTVLIIDGSLSMKATDVQPRRFEEAIRQANKYIENSAAGQEFALVFAGARADVVSNFTNDHQSVIRLLEILEPTDTELNINGALELAFVLLEEVEDGEIIIFTDQPFEHEKVSLMLIGNDASNIGITALDIRALTGRIGEYHVRIEVSNFSKERQDVPLIISQGNRVIIRDSFSLSSATSMQKEYVLRSDTRVVFRASIQIDDDLVEDNVAYFVLGPSDPVRVLMVSQGNFFLERALLSIPNIRAFIKSDLIDEEEMLYDLLILDGIDVNRELETNVIYVDSIPREVKVTGKENGSFPTVSWRDDHSLLRFMDVSEIIVTRQTQIENNDPDVQTIIETTEGPLVLIKEGSGGRKWLYLAFPILESNFPLQVGFPIFLANAIDWFFTDRFDVAHLLSNPGEPHFLTLSPRKIPVTVVSPSRQEVPLFYIFGQFLILDTDEIGVYSVTLNDGSEYLFTVNTFSKLESDIRRVDLDSRKEIKTLGLIKHQNRLSLWQPIVLVTLLILIVEWYLYQKPSFKDKGGV